MSALSSASSSHTSRSFPQLAPSKTMMLHTSPFDGWRGHKRHATIHFVAIDNPWDDDNRDKESTHIVIDALSEESVPPEELQSSQHITIAHNAVTHKPLSYILGKEAAPFTSLLCTLAYANLRPVPDSSLYTTHNWALKWIGRPVNSDFSKVNLRYFQKLNHFPQTWRLGKKDELQRHMRRVEEQCNSTICPEGWILPDEADECLDALRSECNAGLLFICKPTTSACGRGIVLMEGGSNVSLPFQINSNENENNTLISELNALQVVWPDAAAHNRKGNTESVNTENTNMTSVCNQLKSVNFNKQRDIRALRERAQRSLRFSRPLRWVVQRYVDNPYLIHGYKFDLRLYVVVTSYAPLRLYVYNEGLVRMATSPYYTENTNTRTQENNKEEEHGTELLKKEEEWQESMKRDEASVIADACCLTAHLTNFTVNKESKLFVKPTMEETRTLGDKDSDPVKHDALNKVDASKWTFAVLKTYLENNGIDWDATMESVHSLLRSVFASITPHVCEELEIIDGKLDIHHKEQKMINNIYENISSSNGNSMHSTRAPCTFHGISPFFQIFGVDVLLRQPTLKEPTLLIPVLMEVNIMPSLSTHYSWLDQHIKGNFIADTLTLIGLTPLSLSINAKDDGCGNVTNENKNNNNTTNMKNVSNGTITEFLSTLKNVSEVEVCMTTEEELLRSLPNFTRLYPSCHVTEKEMQWLHSTIHTFYSTSNTVSNHDGNNNNNNGDSTSVHSKNPIDESTTHYSILNEVLYKLEVFKSSHNKQQY